MRNKVNDGPLLNSAINIGSIPARTRIYLTYQNWTFLPVKNYTLKCSHIAAIFVRYLRCHLDFKIFQN